MKMEAKIRERERERERSVSVSCLIRTPRGAQKSDCFFGDLFRCVLSSSHLYKMLLVGLSVRIIGNPNGISAPAVQGTGKPPDGGFP